MSSAVAAPQASTAPAETGGDGAIILSITERARLVNAPRRVCIFGSAIRYARYVYFLRYRCVVLLQPLLLCWGLICV